MVIENRDNINVKGGDLMVKNNENTERVKRLIKIAGFGYWGGKKDLARRLRVNEKSFLMAINGYRPGPRYQEILAKADVFLSNILMERDKEA